MPGYLKQSTAAQSRALGPFVSDSDFKTVQTGLTIANTDIKLIVNGGASANKNSGGGTHRVNGEYGVTFDATDTATCGEMKVSVVVSGALPVWDKFFVIEEAVYDALFAASAPGYLQPTVAGRTLDVSAGGEAGVDWANVGSPTTSVALTGTTIAVTQKVDVDTIKTNPVANGGTVTFPTNATLASTTNITAGTVTTATNVTTVNGLAAGVITATAIAADAITAAKVADGAIDRATFAADTGMQSVRSNTATAGAGSTVTLDASASATNDFYKGDLIYLTGGTGVGQYRVCTGYVGATKVATVTPAWATNPDNTSTFAVVPHGMVDLEAIAGAAVSTSSAQLGVSVVSYASGQAPLQPTVAGRTLDVSAGGEAGVDWANVGSPTTTVGLSGTTVKTATDVETDTQDIQSRLPAALVSGRIDASVGAMAANTLTATAIASDAITAAKIADGAIDAATFAAGAINAAAIAADAITDAKVAADVTIASVTGAVGSVTGNVGGNVVGSVASVTARVTANTDQLAGQTVTAAAGVTFPTSVASPTNITAGTITTTTNLTNAPTSGDFTATMKTSLNAATPSVTVSDKTGFALTSAYDAAKTAAQAGDAMALTSGERTTLAGVIWDRLTSALTAVGSIGKLLVDNINATISSRLPTSSYTAPLDAAGVRGAVGLASANLDTQLAALPTADENADAVWEEPIADHSGTAGSTAEALSAAGAAGDPWATALPGAYGSGTAGKIVGDNLNATVSSRSSHSAADVWASGTRTLTSFGTLVADTATAVWAAVTRTLTAGTNIVLAKGVGVTGFNDLDASGVRTAVGLASANLDTQLADLPTNAELATALGTADDAVLSAIGGLNNLSAAQVNAEVDTAISDAALATAATLALVKAKTDLLPASPAATADIPTAAQNADKLLGRNLAGGSDGGRTVTDALRPLRNKTEIVGSTLTVTREDDTTTAWTAAVTTAPGDPLTSIDPA
jgi:hypothetical protein